MSRMVCMMLHKLPELELQSTKVFSGRNPCGWVLLDKIEILKALLN